MTWTVADCASVLQTIAGHDEKDPDSSTAPVPDFSVELTRDIKGIRIGVVTRFWRHDLPADNVLSDALMAALETLRALGASVGDAELPPLVEYARPKVTIQLPEIFSVYGEDVRRHPELFGPKFRNRIAAGADVGAVDYVRAQRRRLELIENMRRVMAQFDLLLTAGTYPARNLVEVAAESQLNKVEITLPFSMTGFPALSICIGFTPDGLPLAMQIIGRPFEEQTILRVAHAYEGATPWRDCRPRL
jgi:aspartyl-tRNA(Asn)/glutamyl-tRNA(Gln) amidotransferase subunit A